MRKGFTGISFPFRVGVRGGVVLSSTSTEEVPHIVEAMQQILLTRPLERSMEFYFKSDVDTAIFESNDTSSHTLIKYQIEEALKTLEDRIEVISITLYGENGSLFADIEFKVLLYDTNYATKIKVGELNEITN